MKKEGTKYWMLFALIAIVVIIYVASWLLIDSSIEDTNSRGVFGDKFGAINALFSGLAFAGLIYTIILQRNELCLQRTELSAQRDEFNQQNATLKLQRFENTFFNMLDAQQQIANNLYLEFLGNTHTSKNPANPQTDEYYKGREVFQGAFVSTSLHSGLGNYISTTGIKGFCDSQLSTIFDHYFSNFYTILKFIDETKVFDEENVREKGETVYEAKLKYATILRAGLSRYELVVLYYYGLSDGGVRKLKPLLEKYCMLNNLNKYLLVLSNDSKIAVNLPEHAKDIANTFRKYGYSGTDYELLLTDNKNEHDKYHYSAFENSEIAKSDLLNIIENRNSVMKKIIGAMPVMTKDEVVYSSIL